MDKAIIFEMVKTEFSRHKLRTSLTVLGVVIGVFLISTMLSFSEGIRVSVRDSMSSLTDVITLVSGSGDISFQNMMDSEIDESFLADIETRDDIKTVLPYVYGVSGGIQVAGYDFDKSLEFFPANMFGLEKGNAYEDSTNEVALGYALAKKLDKTVGDTISFRGKNYEVVGVLKEIGNPQDDNMVSTSVSTAQEILNMEGKYTVIMVKAFIQEEVESIADDINRKYDDIQAITPTDMLREVEKMLGQLNIMIYALGSISTFIAGLVITNVMVMSVRERKREIGVMKAVGATNQQVVLSILGESVSIALIGGLIGLFLASIASFAIASALGSMISKITLPLVAKSLSFAVFLGAIGGVIPAYRAARLDPIDALRYE